MSSYRLLAENPYIKMVSLGCSVLTVVSVFPGDGVVTLCSHHITEELFQSQEAEL